MKYAPVLVAILSLVLGGLSAYAADLQIISVSEYKAILLALVPILVIQTISSYFKEY